MHLSADWLSWHQCCANKTLLMPWFLWQSMHVILHDITEFNSTNHACAGTKWLQQVSCSGSSAARLSNMQVCTVHASASVWPRVAACTFYKQPTNPTIVSYLAIFVTRVTQAIVNFCLLYSWRCPPWSGSLPASLSCVLERQLPFHIMAIR